jgi:pimeloyl-ACP methyl ester carboxylesterase
MAQQLGAKAFVKQSRALISRPDQTRTLKNIKVPSLILCGENDKLCNVQIHKDMAALIKESNLCVVANAGHLPTLENAITTNRSLREWLK